MKNILIFIILILLILFIFSYDNNKEIATMLEVEDVYDESEFKEYYLLFDEFNLNTRNFIDVFSFFNKYEYSVVEIIPYITDGYIKDFKDKKFLFYSSNLEDILNKFSKEYLDIYNDNNEFRIYQINIKEVRIKVLNNTLYEFLNKNKKIKYREIDELKYKYIF